MLNDGVHENGFFDNLTKYRNCQICLISNEYLNQFSFLENIFVEAEKLNIVILPNDSKCLIPALNLEKLKP